MTKGFVSVPDRGKPVLRPYQVTGLGPGRRVVVLTVDATDTFDAIAEAKKRVALNCITAKEVK